MINTTCLVAECSRGAHTAGLCAAHYQRKRKYGDPEFLHQLNCALCGIGFESWTLRSKYCSDVCLAANRDANARKTGPTCADCGIRMHRGKGVLPQGQARCLECKNGGRGYYEIDGRRVSHGKSGYHAGCRCDICRFAKREANMSFKAKVKSEYGVNPSTLYKRRYRERVGVSYRRAPKDWIEPDVRLALYERDDWVCHLCSSPVDRSAHFNDDYAPSLDHLVPRMHGGSDEPSNLRTAHRICNSLRQDAFLVV